MVHRRRRSRRPAGRRWLPLLAALVAAGVGLTLLTLGLLASRVDGASLVHLHPAPQVAEAAAPDLSAPIRQAVAASGGRAGVAVIDLRTGRRFAYLADDNYPAGSTYKFPALMAEAERLAAGKARTADQLCYQDADAEDGWFHDYDAGTCLTLQEVAARAATYSDNTAGHMLVDDVGGTAALNAYARSRGARASRFFDPNQTTASDLATLWAAEAGGQAGGAPAQAWLFPLLTHTKYEAGIPAGVPSGTTVVHKVGFVDDAVDDAGVVTRGDTRYVLAITTDGLGGDAGWALVARISAIVWSQESATLGG